MTDAPPISRIPNIAAKNLPPREDRDWALSAELLDEAGITYRQLDYWCRTNLLTSREDIHGSGWTRSFHHSQVDRARIIHQLLESGMSLPVIRDVIDEVQATGTVQIGVLTITVQPIDQSGDAA